MEFGTQGVWDFGFNKFRIQGVSGSRSLGFKEFGFQ